MIQETMSSAQRPTSLTDASDEEVLREAVRDPDQFGILLDRYQAAFLRRATYILKSSEDAEEAVQDTFTRIYLYADRYQSQEGAQFSSWAYAILARTCFTRYQKLKKRRGSEFALDPEHYERLADESSVFEDLSAKNEILMAFAKLPEAAARILRFQFLEGKSQEEIANLEGSSIPAIKTRVHRAKKLFRQALTDTNATTYGND